MEAITTFVDMMLSILWAIFTLTMIYTILAIIVGAVVICVIIFAVNAYLEDR